MFLHFRHVAPPLLLAAAACPVGGGTGSANQNLSATVSAIATVTVAGTTNLTPGANPFDPFTGNATLNYRGRTTPTGGGTITLEVTSDFQPSGGPSAANNTLQYTCSGATLGSACSGTQTGSTTIQTPVLTLPASACTGGGGVCSSQDLNSVNVNFTLTDDPSYATGTFTAKVTFTISAT